VRSERDAAEAQLAAAQAGLTSAREGVAYTEIRAPYRFVVAKRLVQVGEAVVPGTPLMDSVALRQLRVNVEVPQSIAATVRRLQRALVYAADAGNACFEASQITLSPQAAIASSTFAARLAVPEQASSYPCPLEPGMYVRVGLVVGETPRLLIPASAIVQRSEVTAAYVLDGHGGIGLRYLRLGHRQGDRVEVLAGLSADERVVTDVPAAIAAIVAAGRR
jgi:RND family efflux transporter MFP subunit